MDAFEVSHAQVALGGDKLNTVPVYHVTPAEIAVLQAIHGHDAIFDIKPVGTSTRQQRVERERLAIKYGNAKDSNGKTHVETLFPGAAARVFVKLDELPLADTQFWREPVRRGNTERQNTLNALNESATALAAPGTAIVLDGETPPAPPADEPDAEDQNNGLDELPADEQTSSAFE